MSRWTSRTVTPRHRLAQVALGAGLLALALLGPWAGQARGQVAAPRESFAARVVELTNRERQKAGLEPLAMSRQLSQAAQAYVEVLAATGCFAHTCGPVPEMAQRGEQAGYTAWTALGENLAAGYPTPEAVVAGWMSSEGHRANILNPQFTEIGVGTASSRDRFGRYWTQELGARAGGALAPPAPDGAAVAEAAPAEEWASTEPPAEDQALLPGSVVAGGEDGVPVAEAEATP